MRETDPRGTARFEEEMRGLETELGGVVAGDPGGARQPLVDSRLQRRSAA